MHTYSLETSMPGAVALHMPWQTIGPKTFASHADHVANLGKAQPEAAIAGVPLFLPPNVYHPGIGLSSSFLVNAVIGEALAGAVLDLGCGSGFVGMSLYRPGIVLTLSDIADSALESTRENLRRTGVPGEVVYSNLYTGFAHRCFDAILFNPPLFDKAVEHEAEIALCDPAGDLLSCFLHQSLHHLNVNGTLYFVASNLMNQEALLDGLSNYHYDVIDASYCEISEVWRWAIAAHPKCQEKMSMDMSSTVQ